MKRTLRIPTTLAFTVIGCTLACGGQTAPTADAAADASTSDVAITDGASDDVCNATIGCEAIAADASCPKLVCSIDECSIDAGCSPFV